MLKSLSGVGVEEGVVDKGTVRVDCASDDALVSVGIPQAVFDEDRKGFCCVGSGEHCDNAVGIGKHSGCLGAEFGEELNSASLITNCTFSVCGDWVSLRVYIAPDFTESGVKGLEISVEDLVYGNFDTGYTAFGFLKRRFRRSFQSRHLVQLV